MATSLFDFRPELGFGKAIAYGSKSAYTVKHSYSMRNRHKVGAFFMFVLGDDADMVMPIKVTSTKVVRIQSLSVEEIMELGIEPSYNPGDDTPRAYSLPDGEAFEMYDEFECPYKALEVLIKKQYSETFWKKNEYVIFCKFEKQ